MDKVKKEFKKANINANNDFDFYQIQRKSDFLLPCEVIRGLDEIIFEYTIDNEKPFTTIKELTLLAKYRALINIKYLAKDVSRLKISLDPDNLYYDTNLIPKAMNRDVYDEMGFDEVDFVKQYKSLLAYVLQNKYSFEDIYQGGNQLLSMNKITAKYAKINDLNELIRELNNDYEELSLKRKNSIMEVDKKSYKRLKMISKGAIFLLIISILAGAYFGGYRLYEETVFKDANEQYIKQDYISVIDTLNDLSVSRMNKNTKYILAVSNVKSEALNEDQKNNILSSLTLNADARILEFWIYLGKSLYDEAIDIAKQLGNNEYLAYAYMKEKANVENDKSLSGSDREEKLKEIEEHLKNIDLGTE